MSARYAFLGGALGGAGYAFFESLFLPQPGEEWAITMVARAGTPLIHAFNTGLVCWGLAEGVRRRRWLLAAGAYVLAVGLHGMWNLAAIGIGLASIGAESSASSLGPSLMKRCGLFGAVGIVRAYGRFTGRADLASGQVGFRGFRPSAPYVMNHVEDEPPQQYDGDRNVERSHNRS